MFYPTVKIARKKLTFFPKIVNKIVIFPKKYRFLKIRNIYFRILEAVPLILTAIYMFGSKRKAMNQLFITSC